jgi:hypothetical protein
MLLVSSTHSYWVRFPAGAVIIGFIKVGLVRAQVDRMIDVVSLLYFFICLLHALPAFVDRAR